MLKIGNVNIDGRVFLAPMAGVCNSAFRKIIKEMGCSLVFAEMVSDKGLIYNSQKTKDMLYFEECERPIAQQIFGSDKDTFVEELSDMRTSFIFPNFFQIFLMQVIIFLHKHHIYNFTTNYSILKEKYLSF